MTSETSKAPERIWANFYGGGVPASGDCFDDPIVDGLTEYTRTDTIPRWSTDMDAAPVGVDVLIWSKGAGCDVATKDDDGDWWISDQGTGHDPTHWMPITPPEGE